MQKVLLHFALVSTALRASQHASAYGLAFSFASKGIDTFMKRNATGMSYSSRTAVADVHDFVDWLNC